MIRINVGYRMEKMTGLMRVSIVLLAWLVVSSWSTGTLVASEARANNPGRFLGAKSTVYPDWFKQSFLEFADDIRTAADNDKRVMVLFHQDACPYCNALVERNLSQKRIEEKVRKHFDVIAINMWGDRDVLTVNGTSYTEKSFARALRVQFTPTLIFFNEQGKVVLRLNGYLPPDQFETALDYVSLKKEKQFDYRDFVKIHLPPPMQGELIAEDFFLPATHDLFTNSQSKKPAAVFFEQKHCPDCEVMHATAMKDPKTRELLKQFNCIQLDMWSDTSFIAPEGVKTTARQWAKELGVHYAPSIIFFESSGREIIRVEASFKTFHIQSIFDYVLSDAYKSEPDFQRYISARAKRIRENGKDVDIWK